MSPLSASVTDGEVVGGILSQPPDMVTDRILCYRRKIQGLTDYLTQPNTERFIDITSSAIDTEAQSLLTELKYDQIPHVLPGKNIRDYTIKWEGVNLEASTSQDHLDYLTTFSEHFVDDMKRLIDRTSLSNQAEMAAVGERLYTEVLHHLRFASTKLQVFCGRAEILERIQHLVSRAATAGSKHLPIVIHGRSGYGKTALMAKCAEDVHTWLGEKTVNVVRFLGTSSGSSNIRDTLVSVIEQICTMFDYTPPGDEKMEKMGEVRRYFIKLLERIETHHQQYKLVIMLDSIDQLSDTFGAHEMTWLPLSLPSNVNIVLTMLSDRYSCLDNTKLRLPSEDNFLELGPLSESVGEEIIVKYMSRHSRRLTEEQTGCILKMFESCGQPLFLKLVMDEALTWASYTSIEQDQLGGSVTEVRSNIMSMFNDGQNTDFTLIESTRCKYTAMKIQI